MERHLKNFASVLGAERVKYVYPLKLEVTMISRPPKHVISSSNLVHVWEELGYPGIPRAFADNMWGVLLYENR